MRVDVLPATSSGSPVGRTTLGRVPSPARPRQLAFACSQLLCAPLPRGPPADSCEITGGFQEVQLKVALICTSRKRAFPDCAWPGLLDRFTGAVFL
jgi:hypothetical protein